MKTLKLIILFTLLTAASFAQCKGLTKKGEPCRSIMLVKGTGYCRFHNPNAIHCAYIKKDGQQCKMMVKKEGEFCRVHNTKNQ